MQRMFSMVCFLSLRIWAVSVVSRKSGRRFGIVCAPEFEGRCGKLEMLGRVILKKNEIPSPLAKEFPIGAIAERLPASQQVADALPDRPARARPAAAHGAGAMEQDGDLAVAQADEPGVEGDKRV